MRIIGLGGFANVGKTTILKKLIDDLKTRGFKLEESLIDAKSANDLHATFKNSDNDDIIFIATGGDNVGHVLNNINEAKIKGAKILVTPYRISRNDDVQDIISEDPEAMLISKPKYSSAISKIEDIYVERLESCLI
jgi:Uncharacterized proteins, homologs of microcin C7 resistance protein MccF